VIQPDEHFELAAGVDQRRDPARVAGALLDRDDAVDLLVDADDQLDRHVHARGLGVVVDHDGQAAVGDGGEEGDHFIRIGAVAERRQAHDRGGARVLRVVGVGERGQGRARRDTGDHRDATGGGLDDGLHDRAALLGREAAGLAHRARGHEAVHAGLDQLRDVVLERGDVDLVGRVERGGDGGDDAFERH
jgi:hypothetical protein